ncbi:MAG TPA: SDR family NAD(P)-dependent oxidoreductase [Candidatus Binatia bacterium]|nr:SDR family NAD(P)-dependent oxidoreductase [Candidatus Binatia bacterium]
MSEQSSRRDHDEFSGQVAVVSGGGSGIGRAAALALASRGAALYLLGRDSERLQKVREEVGANGKLTRCYPIDLTRDSDVEELQQRVRNDFGAVDILIHSAGIISLGGVGSAPIADFDRQYRTNVRAVYLLTQTMLPLLKERRGQIVFFNSTAGLTANANAAQYSAAKHAIKAIADSLREEVNPAGLRVLTVYIGRTATPMQETVHSIEGKTYRPERLLQPEDVTSVVLNALSLPRTAEVTEITIRPLTKPL